jgi:Tol biopolymer transport system component
VHVTVTPASLALVAGDSLKWLQAGQASVRIAGLVHGDSVVRTLTVDVPAPPLVVFDGVRTVSGIGNRDVFAVALDGLDFVRLTTDALEDYNPTVRGSTLVFVSSRSGSRELWRQPLAGGAAVRITTNALDESDPRLSPDGTRIAYVDFNGGFPRVRTVNLTGTGDARWTPADGVSLSVEASPAWSPTGDRIAYVTTREGNAGIWVGATSGAAGSATRLVGGAGTGNNVEPSWSPDGTEIVFASDRGGGTDLWVVTVATGVTVRITTIGTVGQPVWLPDGRIVFRDYAGGVNRLWVMRRGAPAARTLIDVGSEGGERPQAAK